MPTLLCPSRHRSSSHHRAVLVCSLTLGGVAFPAAAQHAAPRPPRPPDSVLVIPRVTTPPRLEDFLTADPPAGAVAVTDFRQREPGDGVAVSQPTAAYLSYDDRHLYVVFVCHDEPGRVRAGLTKREEIAVDDGVAVHLDTFHDRQRAYRFQANPNGVQLDGILTEGQDDDDSFDTVWQSDGRLTADGYVVRIAIPFRSLRFPNTPTQRWGIALARFVRRTNEEAYWPLVSKRLAGFVPQFATLEGLRDISPGRNIQAIPYAAYTGTRFLDPAAPAFRTVGEQRAGIDLKAVLHDALTVDGTLNPDFSQVESDEPQVTINARFETFFPEKRPFFIENAGYFQTPVDLFFSRRIADPQAGLRVTGKAGRWALGALAINDRAPEEFADLGSEGVAVPRARIGIVRLQRALGRESTVGALVSDRQLAGATNRVFSADARLALTKTWILSGQAIATTARDTTGPRRSAGGVTASLVHDGRNVDYAATYLDLGSDFDAPLGFVPRVGIRQLAQELEVVRRPSGPVVKIGPVLSSEFVWDRDGQLLDRSLEAAWEVRLIGETKLKLAHERAFERFHDLPFATQATKLTVESEWLQWLAVAASYKQGTDVNHKPAQGVAPFLGAMGKGEVTFTLRPSMRVRLDHTYLYSRLSTLPGAAPAGGSGASGAGADAVARVFTDQILREKLNYQFSRALSVRAIVDYATVDRDSTLSRVDPERRWAVDVLLTYLVHPGTALFLGYRDGYENLELLPGSPPTLARTESPATSVGRQVFVKVGYVLRF